MAGVEAGSARCSLISAGEAPSGKHGRDGRTAAAQWLGLCSRSCQTLSLARSMAGMAFYLLGQTRLSQGAFVPRSLLLKKETLAGIFGGLGDLLPASAMGPWVPRVRKEEDKGKPGFNRV